MTHTPDHVRAIEKVRCCNSLHRIVLTNHGRLTLLDHDEDTDAGMDMLRVLNPDLRCRCHEVLWWWRWLTILPGDRLEEHELPRWVQDERTYESVKGAGTYREERSEEKRKLSTKYALRQLPKTLRPWAELAGKVREKRTGNDYYVRPPKLTWAASVSKLNHFRRFTREELITDSSHNTYDRSFNQREILYQDALTSAKTTGMDEHLHEYQRWVRGIQPNKSWTGEKYNTTRAVGKLQARIKHRTGKWHTHFQKVESQARMAVKAWTTHVAGRPFAGLGEGIQVRDGIRGVFILDAPPGPIPPEGDVFLPVQVHHSGLDSMGGYQPCWALAVRQEGEWDLRPLGDNWHDRLDANGWHNWL